MSIEATKAVFSATAKTYDPARAKLIPCFAEFYATAVALLPAGTKTVLDLGAGTGLLSAVIRERFPDAVLHLVDNSAAMLEQARERFRGDSRVSFELGDYTRMDVPEPYCGVVSALSIHHLEDAVKRALLARVYAMVKPGGVFVNAEQILQPTAELEASARAAWLDEVRALGATEQQVADSLLRQQEDRCATVEDQLAWLREAGFNDVRCAFESGWFAVLAGARLYEAQS